MKISSSIIEKAFEQSVYAINITDLDGVLLKVNSAYLRLYEFSNEEEILGKSQRVIRSSKTPDAVYKDMWETISQNKSWSGEITNVTKNKNEAFIYLTINPIFEGNKKIGYMGFSLDRSQQVLLEQQLLHANKLVVLGTVGAGLAHELNNPLTSITLEAEYVQESLESIPGAKKNGLLRSVESIQKNADRMKRVIEHLLAYSRKDASEEWESIGAEELIQDSFLFLEKQLKNREIEIELDIEKGLFLYGNRTHLESVVHNLLTNSRDAFVEVPNENRKISIRINSLNENWLLLVYEDNAGGVSKDILDKIFDPFFTTKEEGTGTGLGLSLTKKIIREHNGKMDCSSENGKTTFTIHLPQNLVVEPVVKPNDAINNDIG